ncbi:hypothetical protein [Streptomyces sp. NPDC000880]
MRQGFAGADFAAELAALEITVVRPARKDEPDDPSFPFWLRQRIESVNWTLKGQLGLADHGARVLSGLWARMVQRILARNAAIWHNWTTEAPRPRGLARSQCQALVLVLPMQDRVIGTAVGTA